MTELALTHEEVRKLLPHQYPFLLVDKVLSISEDMQELVALKNVTADEPFFPGHFPGKPVHNSLPGWVSGWEWTFFISILIVSLPIKFIFKIH